MLASEIISRVRNTLVDPDKVTWPDNELIDYLNGAVSEILVHKPEANSKTTVVTLAQSSKQSIPTDGIALFNVTRLTSPVQRSIRQIELNTLNNHDPSWPGVTGIPIHFSHEKRDPKSFYLYPSPDRDDYQAEIVYSATPARLTLLTEEIPLDNSFENAIHHYICMYAYAKSSKRFDTAKVSFYASMFANSLGLKTIGQIRLTSRTPDERRGASKQDYAQVKE